MTANIDNAPIYDPITKNGDSLSDQWVSWISSFVDTLNSYLTQNGIFMPQLTTVQRDSIKNAVNGQMIYNTTIGSAQYFKAGVWTSF